MQIELISSIVFIPGMRRDSWFRVTVADTLARMMARLCVMMVGLILRLCVQPQNALTHQVQSTIRIAIHYIHGSYYIKILYLQPFLCNIMQILGCGKHGSCIGPNQCACEIGWQGVQCDKCVSVPGCLHGKCVNKSFGCVCDNPAEWSGSLCNIRKYLMNPKDIQSIFIICSSHHNRVLSPIFFFYSCLSEWLCTWRLQ